MDKEPEDDSKQPFVRWWWPLLLVAVVILGLGWITNTAFEAQSQPTTWSELRSLVSNKEIQSVQFNGQMVLATKKHADGEEPTVLRVVAVSSDESFFDLLQENDVAVEEKLRNDCSSTVGTYLIPAALLVGLLWFMFARQTGPTRGMAAFGRSTASMAPEDGTGVTFADVAGVEEAAEELEEVVAFLKTPEKFTTLGGRPPKGVLLVGPPGTGKTLLARAVAGEAGVPFFSISGSAFVEMFVGVGAARVRDLFKNADEHAPCIIFVDELDAVGKARGSGGPAGNEEREQTLNQLLVEMDGFDSRKGIIMMAATNRPETLDQALLRAGRFDRQVLVDRPDLIGREAILKVHAKKYKVSPTVELKQVAKMTPGLAGADLANLLNEAALLAARQEKTAIELSDISEAIERVVAGLEKKSRRLGDDEKRMTAYHECGHAICAAASPGADPVQKISIIPRGMALGYTLTLPTEDRYSANKSQLLNRIVTLFGGRAAEALVFNDVTTGAQDDIRRATNIARKMVTEYGMSKALGAVNYGQSNQNMFGMGGYGGGTSHSPETAERIEVEIRSLLQRGNDRAIEILVKNRALLEEMSLYLIEHEVLDGDIMRDYLSRAEQVESVEDRQTAEWIEPSLLGPTDGVLPNATLAPPAPPADFDDA